MRVVAVAVVYTRRNRQSNLFSRGITVSRGEVTAAASLWMCAADTVRLRRETSEEPIIGVGIVTPRLREYQRPNSYDRWL